MRKYDVIVIGGGVTGCAVARELSRLRLTAAVLERFEDVCSGASKANSGIVHAGFDALPGTGKARMNVRGAKLMPALARDLDIPYRQNGSLVLCFSPEDRPKLEALMARGIQNGVEGLSILEADALREMEPNISRSAVAALHAPTAGIVCPFELTLALAENAAENGVDFHFNAEVSRIERRGNGFAVHTPDEVYECRCVVNAAGTHADEIHAMASGTPMHITPRRGAYCLLDKSAGGHVSSTIFQLPGPCGKGVLVTPTVHGNLLVGPTAVDVEDRDDTASTAPELADVLEKGAMSVEALPRNAVITSFCGLRAHEAGDDFILGEAPDAPGFFDAAGIESPGLTSAPAIGEAVAGMIARRLSAPEKANFIATRRGVVRAASLDPEARRALIKQNPLYGRIVCRCEEISEGEIVDAIRRPLGAKSMDGVKRRVRAGMGRCQGGFCTPRVMEILSRELDVPVSEIRKNVRGSELTLGPMEVNEA